MNSSPGVTFGLPVYNGESFLRRALDGLLAQDRTDIEIVVCDNASTDASLAIAREFESRDSRVRVFHNDRNLGVIANFGRVLELARAPYFAWASCDDRWSPRFASLLSSELDRFPSVQVAMGAVERLRPDGSVNEVIRYRTGTNPNTMSELELAFALAAGRPYLMYIYGLFRTAFLRRAFERFPQVISGDRLFVCQVAMATRFRYVDEVIFWKQLRAEPVHVRFSGEALGGWLDANARLKLILAAGPYLMASPLIPAHRKPMIPFVVAQIAATKYPWLGLRDLARVAATRALGPERARALVGRVRRGLTGAPRSGT